MYLFSYLYKTKKKSIHIKFLSENSFNSIIFQIIIFLTLISVVTEQSSHYHNYNFCKKRQILLSLLYF